MWEAAKEPIRSGVRCRILDAGRRLSFRQLFHRLEVDAALADWYSEALVGSSAPLAFFWEHPPLTKQNFDENVEFVLIDAPALAGLRADPRAFEDQFARHPHAQVVSLANLGGDALLIVPALVVSSAAYPHLAAFLRSAPKGQIRALLGDVARVVRENIGSEPRWLSIAGLDVPWLHLRWDTRPKYYRFDPYRGHG